MFWWLIDDEFVYLAPSISHVNAIYNQNNISILIIFKNDVIYNYNFW